MSRSTNNIRCMHLNVSSKRTRHVFFQQQHTFIRLLLLFFSAHSVNFRLCYITYYGYTLKLLMAIRTFHAYTYQNIIYYEHTTTYTHAHWLVLCLLVCSMWVLSEFLSAKLYEPTRTSADDFRTLRCAVIDLHSLDERARFA